MRGTATLALEMDRATLTWSYDTNDKIGSRLPGERVRETNTHHSSTRVATLTRGSGTEFTLAFPSTRGEAAMQWHCTEQSVEIFPASATAFAPEKLSATSREALVSCRTKGSQAGPLFYIQPEPLVFRMAGPVFLRSINSPFFSEHRVFEVK